MFPQYWPVFVVLGDVIQVPGGEKTSAVLPSCGAHILSCQSPRQVVWCSLMQKLYDPLGTTILRLELSSTPQEVVLETWSKTFAWEGRKPLGVSLYC